MTVDSLEGLRSKIARHRELSPLEVRRALRKDAGLTLMEIAEACGVSFQSVSAWELGTRSPRGAQRERYLDVLRVIREEVA